MSIRTDKALALFASNYNCAQAVLGAFCEQAGLDLDTALRLASGFGGGVQCGEVCGAVSGAVMAIGLRCGYYIENDLEQKRFCNQKTAEFMEKFAGENGSFVCRELLGFDMREKEAFGIEKAGELFTGFCPKMVASAVRLLERMEFERN